MLFEKRISIETEHIANISHVPFLMLRMPRPASMRMENSEPLEEEQDKNEINNHFLLNPIVSTTCTHTQKVKEKHSLSLSLCVCVNTHTHFDKPRCLFEN